MTEQIKPELIDISQYLRDKYVAFIDVLGFSELVFAKDHIALSEYFNTIFETIKLVIHSKSGLQIFSISDSLIITADDNDQEFKDLLTAVQSLHYYLALKGRFIRGAITFGEVAFIKDKNIIVGKGYIKAYKMESLAINPRVIIDPIIIAKHGKNLTEFIQKYNYENESPKKIKLIHEYGETKFRRTIDDAIFVDYASRLVSEKNAMNLEIIFQSIKKGIYGSVETYSKYLWLKKYFTEVLVDAERQLEEKTFGKPDPSFHERQFYLEWFDKFQAL